MNQSNPALPLADHREVKQFVGNSYRSIKYQEFHRQLLILQLFPVGAQIQFLQKLFYHQEIAGLHALQLALQLIHPRQISSSKLCNFQLPLSQIDQLAHLLLQRYQSIFYQPHLSS